jgi:hypothetical protein
MSARDRSRPWFRSAPRTWQDVSDEDHRSRGETVIVGERVTCLVRDGHPIAMWTSGYPYDEGKT